MRSDGKILSIVGKFLENTRKGPRPRKCSPMGIYGFHRAKTPWRFPKSFPSVQPCRAVVGWLQPPIPQSSLPQGAYFGSPRLAAGEKPPSTEQPQNTGVLWAFLFPHLHSLLSQAKKKKKKEPRDPRNSSAITKVIIPAAVHW